MKRASYWLFLAVLPLAGIFRPVISNCRADDGCFCCLCDRCCHFELVDCYTKAAWRRTWWGPNALATPLRGYYIPRPPASCWNGHLCNECHYSADEEFAMIDTNRCEQCHAGQGQEVSPEAAIGFSPASARLGQIRNELDVVGAAAPGRTPAPSR